MPNEDGIYVGRSEEDKEYLEKHFTEGTRWYLYEFGFLQGLFTVGRRSEPEKGRLRNEATREMDGQRVTAYLHGLEAEPFDEK